MRALKYLMAYTVPATVAVAFSMEGAWSYLPLAYAFILVPALELVLPPQSKNLSAAEQEVRRQDRLYDFLLYLLVPLQYIFLLWFAFSFASAPNALTAVGRITSLGVLCGVIGINVGHELGHRRKKWQQVLAQLLLSSSLYAHFFIEHNYGHHRNVATPDDPATAKRGEWLYRFWWRSIFHSYRHAWQLQRQLLKAKKKKFWSAANLMLRFHLGQGLLVLAFWYFFGVATALALLGAALLGIILLETVNYIEHYGLQRQKLNAYRYENTTPRHSWNSNHVLGRLLLFELSRHSDHHAYPHKEYQILSHHHQSPQLPTGYPGMMLLAALPLLFFAVMHPRIDEHGAGIVRPASP